MGLGDSYVKSGAVKNTESQDREHETTLFAKRYVQIETNQQGRWAYNANGTVLYSGYAPKGLAEGTDGWLLHKFTYDASSRAVTRKIYYGNWTARAGYTFE